MVSDPLSFHCLLRPIASIRLISSVVFFHVVFRIQIDSPPSHRFQIILSPNALSEIVQNGITVALIQLDSLRF
ncbi:hypothetical protein LXL04_017086 [Taraxacum kok-saghyz]